MATSNKRISRNGLEFIKGFEWFVPYVYDDAVPARTVKGKLVYKEWKPGDPVIGTLTVLYGHTDKAKHPLKIAEAVGQRYDEAFGRKVLDVDLDECEADVNRLVKVPLTQGQYDALVAFDFNCGVAALKKLIEPLNRGDYDGTRRKFDLYVKVRNKKTGELEHSNGLQRRRDGEQVLWDRPDPQRRTEAGQEIVAAEEDEARGPEIPSEPVDHPAEVAEPEPRPTTLATSEGKTVTMTGIADGAHTVNEISYAAKDSEGTIEFLINLAQRPGFWVAVAIAAICLSVWFKWPRRFYGGDT